MTVLFVEFASLLVVIEVIRQCHITTIRLGLGTKVVIRSQTRAILGTKMHEGQDFTGLRNFVICFSSGSTSVISRL